MRKTLVSLSFVPLLLPFFRAPCLHAEGVVLPSLARALPGIEAGQLLLGELGCVKCHQTEDAIRARLNSREAPLLGQGGLRLTPQYLRGLFLDPQSQKPGSPMPDALHLMAPAEKVVVADALVHFLMSFQENNAADPIAANEFLIQQGRLLYHQIGCVACHAPEQPAAEVLRQRAGTDNGTAIAPPELRATSIPLGKLARKMTVGELARYLLNPLAIRPSGRCPSLTLSKAEATALAIYLQREQAGLKDPSRPPARVAGLEYQYYEQGFGQATELDNAKVLATGTTTKFEISPSKRPENVGLRFTGYIRAPRAGEYTFYTASDDGSLLYLDGRLIVENDGTHAATERSGKIKLEAGEHPAMLTWFNAGGPAELTVSYAGPGLPKQEIPPSALTHLGQPMTPLDEEEFVLDAAKVSQGKDDFARLGCASCHELSGQRILSGNAAPGLAALVHPAGGCLSADPKNGAPRYDLTAGQRQVLAETLAHLDQLVRPLSAAGRVQQAMATYNCYACHSRDGEGGPELGRIDYFTTTSEIEMGDEGRLPPRLTGVGAKLKPSWFSEVLVNQGRARPYMATRMPHFGAENVQQLPSLFAKSDGSAPDETIQRTDIKQGRRLVGTTGLSCITCHLFAGHNSLGIPAMDLTFMPARLQQSWFNRYLRDPSSLRPGTRMPSFWPEGHAVNTDILNGNTEAQIGAIWTYLSLAKDTGLPPGLIQGKMELVVTNEAVIYRHWILGSGPRTISVGYPQRANLAFDADNLRLAVIWQGPFIDTARHRTGRGDGFGGPLGYNAVQLSPGPPFALLDTTQAPWPSQSGAEVDYRLGGYRLDPQRRPVFLYSFRDIQVEDYFVDVPGELDGTFRRALRFKSEHPPDSLWFRAWTGSDIAQQGTGAYLADGKVTLRIKTSGKPILRRAQGRVELLVPIHFVHDAAAIDEEIIW